jgi:hypothetical protein
MLKFSQTNKLMDECLTQAEAYLSKPDTRLRVRNVTGLAALLQAEIVFDRGCYRLRWPGATWVPEPRTEFEPDSQFLDRTGWEDFDNHFHEDALRGWNIEEKEKPGIHHLVLALIGAEILRLKLRDSFPRVRFQVTVSFSVKPMDLDDEEIIARNVMIGWRVSFHAVRKGEMPLSSDLDSYLYEAIGLFDTKPRRRIAS